ncbi:tetratricopeptide repeat-containing protein [Lentzea sp. NPDC059081]|uniref:tetratricopeptide repeat-containing protein n=1 Tax=Lentzea sp. NPDC059081 TaxID=3346719 RepID=UPI0036CD376D
MKPLTIFVAMPGTTLGPNPKWAEPEKIKRHLYEPLRKVLADRLGREVELVIEKDKRISGAIHPSMFAEARNAEVYIADLTGANPNVYLELGVRWALRDNVTVLVCQDTAQDMKFNVANVRAIPYSKDPSELQEALETIAEVITTGLRLAHVDSPVREHVDTIEVRRADLDALHRQIAELKSARGDDLFTAAMKSTAHHRADLLRQVIKVNPGRADAFGELGKELTRAGKEPEAIEMLEQAIRIDRGQAEWWRELGVAQSRHGDLDSAAKSLQEAVNLNGQDSEAYAILGGVHRRRARRTDHQVENLRQARDAYWEASQIDKHALYPLTNVRRLDVLLARDDTTARKAALEEFRNLRQLAEYVTRTEPEAWGLLDYAETLAFSGDAAAAVEAARAGLGDFADEHRVRAAKTAVEPVRDMVSTGWLPDDVTEALQALLAEYEQAAAG